LARKKRLPNYFGYQRFGAQGVGTHEVGKAIVKRDFRGAVELILGRRVHADDGEPAARETTEVGQAGDNPRLKFGQDTERAVAGSLARNPTDHVRALRAAPPRLRRFYVQAFQSFMFNKTLSRALASELDISAMEDGDNWAELDDSELGVKKIHGVRETRIPEGVPMVQLAGYAFRDYGSRFDRLTMAVMAQEGVTAKDFYIKELQEASAEGGFRVPHMQVRDARLEDEREGTAVLGFVLARGQYATVLLREIIKPDDPRASGLA
jgi:tRNA pseudouridine13 synthase